MAVRFVGTMLLVVLAGIAEGRLQAHHSFAGQFDRSKPHTITGTMTKVEWLNPHIYLYVAVKDDAGKETVWAVEGAAPNGLYRQGWRQDTVKVGDVVTVEGWLARDGTKLMNMGSATMGGRKLFSGTASQEN
jgi:Family of unknown function (DUF6152)